MALQGTGVASGAVATRGLNTIPVKIKMLPSYMMGPFMNELHPKVKDWCFMWS